MLIAVPIVLACLAPQPCQPAMAPPNQLVRSASPAAIVSRALPPERMTSEVRSLRDALGHVRIPSIQPSRSHRAQVGLRSPTMSTADKAMLVVAGAVAGLYAGAYLGAAVDDGGEEGAYLGMPIGAAIGGWAVWNLIR
jgi:hypothetical protein